MHLISISQEKSLIVNKESTEIEAHQSNRLINVINFIKNNLHEQISLKQVADIAV